ncbi:MAG: orotidine-5'-phosphate decarboxylase [Actinomycetota bacterium]|nr:MAG: orotidine-5'-phosphate decarboxylase [Actinomycetota bacterium]
MTAALAVALDAPDLATVRAWSGAVAPYVSTLKVGLQVYLRDGEAGVRAARQAAADAGSPCELFLDLKLHDIPATVGGAARSLAPLRPAYVTVHASGGAAMVRAAVEGLPGCCVVAVTVLTSLGPQDLAAVGLAGPAGTAATRLAELAVAAGATGVVCSPQEVAAVRAAVGPEITLITPGIRPAGAALGDQQRVATPQQALADGADLLVVGRPITGAADPGAAAAAMAASLR